MNIGAGVMWRRAGPMMAAAAVILLCIAPIPTSGAEYEGEDIDGVDYAATAYSYSTSRYFDVVVIFDGDEATITFNNGHALALTLDDEEIDDPHSISAFDSQRSVFWDLDVDGLD